ncbi:MAG TPA: hydantoinase/oxoprolinase family protein, partial [Hyphomicrobiaceae bacterium]|nr:hydantoinase/oxoprolinase family protein [Hyphomicrobiaceae bacterium]
TRFHGGQLQLDVAAAGTAVDRVATALGLGREAAADGIIRVVDARMAEGIRLVSVRRGIDPTAFALFSFGGAAGLHASAIARQLSIGRIVVPRIASVLSAWGMLAT